MMRDLQDCLPYVKHLHMEHRRLNEVLRRISGLFAPADSQQSSNIPTQLVGSLADLRAELSHHFAAEESGGCMEEAVSRCPGLSPDAKKVEAEHVVLLQKLDDVIQRATSQPRQTVGVASLKQEFQLFADTLRQHEAAENRILQMGFGVQGDLDE